MTSCSDCAFGVPALGIPELYGTMLECRFHPPRPTVSCLIDPCDRIAQPSIQPANYWCGGWKAKEQPFSFDPITAFKDSPGETWAKQNRDTSGDRYGLDENKPVTYDDPFDT